MQPMKYGRAASGPRLPGGGLGEEILRFLWVRRLLRFAWVPIPAFIAALVLAWLFAPADPVGHRVIRTFLNFVFGSVVPLWVAVMAARSFLATRSVSILMFGTGLFLFGMANLFSNAAYQLWNNLDLMLGVFTVGIAAAGLVHLLGAVVAWSAGDRKLEGRRSALVCSYVLALGMIVGLTAAIQAQLFPLFYEPDIGPTPLRRTLLGFIVILFAWASALLIAMSNRLNWSFGKWYGWALALIAVSLIGFMLSPEVGSITGWVGRGAQYLGGLYLLAAVLQTRKGYGYWEPITYSALQESEERFRALAEATWEGVAISQNGVITDANEQLARMLGYRPDELMGKSIPALVPPERADQVMAGLFSEAEVAMEHPMIRKDGSQIAVESYGRTFSGRRQVMQLWAVRDITTRKRQERAVRESEEQLRALFDNMSEGMGVGEIVLDENGSPCDIRFIRINRAFQDQTGLSSELLGKPVSTVLPQLEREWIDVNARVARSGYSERFEGYNRDTQRYYEGVSYGLGKGRFATLFRDVTARRRHEEVLRKAREDKERHLAQLKAILNQMTEGLVIYNPEGRLVAVNPTGISMLGFESVDEVRERMGESRMLFDAFELSDLEGKTLKAEEWPVSRVLRQESFSSYVIRIRRLDTGNSWIASCGGAPVYDEQGKLLVSIVTMRDVTAQQEAQEALKRSRDELEQRVAERTAELQQRADQLARLTSELTLTEQRERKRLAQVLHDHLQQLLVGARFSLHLASRDMNDEQKARIESVDDLLNDAISASRSLTMELSPPILHEGGLAAGLDWLARWMKKTQGLDVELNADSALWVDREDVRLLAFQAVRELLLNISKHAQVKNARVELAREGDEMLRVTVEDRGVGFNVTEVMGARKAREGFGLFSLRERVDLMGGKFHISSQPGEGSRFTLIAPLWPEGVSEEEKKQAVERRRAARKPVSAAVTGHDKIRLLLVDDHAVVRQGLSVLLNAQEDVEIVGEAADGATAIDQARELHPDIILMDFSLPEMDGVEATRVIHDEMPDVQIIGLSMYEASDRASAMLEAGAFAYLCKSGKSEQLLQTIRNAVESRRTA